MHLSTPSFLHTQQKNRHWQLCAIVSFVPSICHRHKPCVLSTCKQEVIYFYSVEWAAGQTADLVCMCPYVSYEARQAAAVSPQSAGLEASLAPLQCYATQAWPTPGSVECLEEHSHCTHMRCHWGSEGIQKKKKKHTVREVQNLLSTWVLILLSL